MHWVFQNVCIAGMENITRFMNTVEIQLLLLVIWFVMLFKDTVSAEKLV